MSKEYQPKKYFSKGRTLEWEKDLTPEQMDSLRKGEAFILLDKNKLPYRQILMDGYNQIRERKVGTAFPPGFIIATAKKEEIKEEKQTRG